MASPDSTMPKPMSSSWQKYSFTTGHARPGKGHSRRNARLSARKGARQKGSPARASAQ